MTPSVCITLAILEVAAIVLQRSKVKASMDWVVVFDYLCNLASAVPQPIQQEPSYMVALHYFQVDFTAQGATIT